MSRHFSLGAIRMWTSISLGTLVIGTVIACQANRRPEHRALLEAIGGLFLISGLLLIGRGLEAALHG